MDLVLYLLQPIKELTLLMGISCGLYIPVIILFLDKMGQF